MARVIGRYRRDDHEFGMEQEELMFPILNEYFGGSLVKSPNKRAKYDFYDDACNYELKSRRIPMQRFSTTYITTDKVTQTDKKIIFIFNYQDALAYIEYEKEKFDQYEVVEVFNKPNFDIPITDLTLIQSR